MTLRAVNRNDVYTLFTPGRQAAEQRAFAYLFALLPAVMKANFIERGGGGGGGRNEKNSTSCRAAKISSRLFF